jgi:hypothetical protein
MLVHTLIDSNATGQEMSVRECAVIFIMIDSRAAKRAENQHSHTQMLPFPLIKSDEAAF